jgi:hypothetical protein
MYLGGFLTKWLFVLKYSLLFFESVSKNNMAKKQGKSFYPYKVTTNLKNGHTDKKISIKFKRP